MNNDIVTIPEEVITVIAEIDETEIVVFGPLINNALPDSIVTSVNGQSGDVDLSETLTITVLR